LNFLERQLLLRNLYKSILDKTSILVGKRVSRIDYSQKGVVVQCKDGTSYEGTVVIGADGCHSIVRQEMWRNIDAEEHGAVSQQEIHSSSKIPEKIARH
jgi:2-polyprenyl-6-methoxyphenol hydroxylase-like FAD-dependent oxidoreductase